MVDDRDRATLWGMSVGPRSQSSGELPLPLSTVGNGVPVAPSPSTSSLPGEPVIATSQAPQPAAPPSSTAPATPAPTLAPVSPLPVTPTASSLPAAPVSTAAPLPAPIAFD